MLKKLIGFTITTALTTFSALAAPSVVWQLGTADNSSKEFIPYDCGEFKTSARILNLPGYDRTAKSFMFNVPANGGTIAAPAMPGGISGSHSGNNSIVSRQEIVWDDNGGGWRELEIKLLPGGRNMKNHRLTPNENMDIDGSDIIKAGLRVELPDGKVFYRELPYDLESEIQARGPAVIRVRFQAKPGVNRIELKETSGNTYGRLYGFDYLTLRAVDKGEALPPVIEFTPGKGFMVGQIYDTAHPATIKVSFRNLQPGVRYQARTEFVDYFDQSRDKMEFTPEGKNGMAEKTITCPTGTTGHFRMRTTLTADGKPVKVHMGQNQAETRVVAIRTIAPQTPEEIKNSFIGLCGLTQSPYFDEATYPRRERVERYRAYRRALQIQLERIHSLDWQFLERREGELDWAYWDWLLDGEKADHMRVQLAITGIPEWLFKKGYPDRKTTHLTQIYFAVPPDMKKWGDVCAAVATRYRDRVEEIEIWNEPSEQSIFWQNGTAQDYFNTVKTASEAIRKAVPEMKIVAETVWSRQPEFSVKLYQLGIGKYIDHPADHYMTDERIGMINRMLNRYGTNAGLLCNEAKCDRSGPLGQVDEKSRREAARNLIRNYIYANANGIQRIYNFELLANTCRLYGAINPDDTPKYTYAVLKTLVNRFTGATFYRTFQPVAGIEAFAYRYFSPQRIQENMGDSVLLLNNSGTTPAKLRLFVNREQVRVVDLMDNARTLQCPGGVAEVTVGADPVILLGADLKALDNANALRTELRSGRTSGFDFNMELGLERLPELSRAEVTVTSPTLLTAPLTDISLEPGQNKAVKLPVKPGLTDGNHMVQINAKVHTATGVIPVERTVSVVASRLPVGANLFTAWNSKAWHKWGDIKLEYPTATAVKASVAGTGAISLTQPLAVIPGQTYYLRVPVRGQGIFRIQMETKDANGKKVAVVSNFLSGKLEESGKTMQAEWVVPANVATAGLQFYQYKTDGWFELEPAQFFRLEAGVPVNRQLYMVEAPRRNNITIDGRLEDWKNIPFTPVTERVGNVPGLRAKYAAAWSGSTIYLAVVVTDQHHNPMTGDKLWQGDSIQIDFEPLNRNTAVPSTQFGIAAGPQGAEIYRFSTIPSEDIVESYKCGPHPAGVKATVTRQGDQTIYEAAIPAAAIWPTLALTPGKQLGFSLLINDRDATARQGWLQWSDGIGGTRNSTLFGRMILAE